MFDCHCHLLDLVEISDNFLPSLPACTVEKLFCNSVSARQWPLLAELAQKYPQITPFYGLHPWHLEGIGDNDLLLLADFLQDKQSGCGEIGLDRLCGTDFSLQEKIFRAQLDIAADTRSFVAIHCVKAWGIMLDILAEYQGKISFMLHSFGGSREVMERLVAMGGMISFSHRVTHSSQKKLQDVLKATPLKHLLLETDFPAGNVDKDFSLASYCRTLTDLYAFAAHLRQIPEQELAHIIERNGTICTD